MYDIARKDWRGGREGRVISLVYDAAISDSPFGSHAVSPPHPPTHTASAPKNQVNTVKKSEEKSKMVLEQRPIRFTV